jgi:DNA-binding response OmpR family regulator
MVKVLIVEDELEIAHSLQGNLERYGYKVLTASDGATALETARREAPQLILLDLMLPILDGYRVLKLLKSDERYRKMPILVITARADSQDLTLAMECGADGCLVKPVMFDVLLERIRAIAGNGEKGNADATPSNGLPIE